MDLYLRYFFINLLTRILQFQTHFYMDRAIKIAIQATQFMFNKVDQSGIWTEIGGVKGDLHHTNTGFTGFGVIQFMQCVRRTLCFVSTIPQQLILAKWTTEHCM
jgi:hypothetical protein